MTPTAPSRTVATPYPGIPRWVKVAAIIAIALALVVVIILVTGIIHTPPVQHGP